MDGPKWFVGVQAVGAKVCSILEIPRVQPVAIRSILIRSGCRNGRRRVWTVGITLYRWS
jgi:hypothetical protein